MRDITMDGLWWLPHDPDRKIAGTVSVNDEDQDPTLRLIGAFFQAEPQPAGASLITVPEQHEMLHGRCEDKPVTLLDCRSLGHEGGLSSPEHWRQRLLARLMLVGVWLDSPDETYFDRISIGVDHLLA